MGRTAALWLSRWLKVTACHVVAAWCGQLCVTRSMQCWQGYNAAIIAYGQTGTGKTFTMEGGSSGASRGIIPRAIEDVFATIGSDAVPNSKFLVRASYLQIYNEVRISARSAPAHVPVRGAVIGVPQASSEVHMRSCMHCLCCRPCLL